MHSEAWEMTGDSGSGDFCRVKSVIPQFRAPLAALIPLTLQDSLRVKG